jgi:dUTP pyrophosphatase
VHVETPHECVTLIKSKSGLNVRYDITSEGVIDEGYDGEIVVKMYNHGDRDMRFFAGDKITQILIMPVRYPLYVHVTEIKGGERGSDGFGSTGA